MPDRTVLVVEDFDDTRAMIRMLPEMKGRRLSEPTEFGLLDETLGRHAA